MMKYKDYVANVEYDSENKFFHGEVLGISDVVTFQGTTPEELEAELKNSIEDYLDFCKEKKKDPCKAFSGTLSLRMPPENHKLLAVNAQKESKSINDWINEAIREKISKIGS